MEPPSKRPRLQIFGEMSSDIELDTARTRNDLTLKSRFESIFEKYSHDFSGVGDEVDLFTGDVIVNNGHIASMTNEIDTGLENRTGSERDGRAFLLAMAAAPHDDELVNPDADQVMQSIETIADNTVQANQESISESEDDLFHADHAMEEISTESDDTDAEAQEAESFMKRYEESDTDSLFEGRSNSRETSVDSLFDRPNQMVLDSAMDSSRDNSDCRPQTSEMTEEELLAKYRPMIRQEMMEILEKRHEVAEARIEPAWRIPVQIIYPPSPTKQTAADTSVKNPTPQRQPDQEIRARNRGMARAVYQRSLWTHPRVREKSTTDLEENSPPTAEREESEDPLQSGFSSEREESMARDTSSDFDNFVPPTNEAENDELYAEEAERKQLLTSCLTGACPYCKVNYGNKSGVMAHWDRTITKPPRHKSSTDPHDLEMMRNIRSTVVRRVRERRLILVDFRTMVELHEGAGLSFEQIADSKTLWTRKTAFQLRDIYDKHRSIPLPNHSPPPSCRWTSEEEERLTTLCKNDRMTLATVTRKFPKKDEIDVGNKLAERFLHELGRSSKNPTSNSGSAASLPQHRTAEAMIKVESEDELFQ